MVSVPGLARRELMLSSYFLFLLEGFVVPITGGLSPLTVLFVIFDIGGWTCRFPLFVRCPWVRLGCSPNASAWSHCSAGTRAWHLHSLAWAAPSWHLSGLTLPWQVRQLP